MSAYSLESFEYNSDYLDRKVKIDTYFPTTHTGKISILLVNDGQDLVKMPFLPIINQAHADYQLSPLLVVAMHCNADRRLEYGTADILDYNQRGSRARYHRKFILKELLPFIFSRYQLRQVADISFAGFSLGGLSALDIAWKHPDVFSKVGVFSGSLWWRLKDLKDGYEEETDRIMHKLVREGNFAPGLKFFFEVGTQDEKADRNNNGIIDSIDDTLALIAELEEKGYDRDSDIMYLELADGRHDVPTWARAFPAFLEWGWGRTQKEKQAD